MDADGNLYIADSENSVIRKVDTSGMISTIAGNGTWGYSGDNGPATSASLQYPVGVSADAAGNIYIADSYNYVVRKVDTSGIITTFAGTGTWRYSGDNGPARSVAIDPSGLAVDGAGNVYIADWVNNVIRRVTVAGDSDTLPPATTASPAGGAYTSAQSVMLRCNDGLGSGCGNIYYTSDGSTPTTDSAIYTSSINISATTTLKFFAADNAGNSEGVKSEVYFIADMVPDAFTFTDQANVTLNTVVTSNSITVSGINSSVGLSITGGEYKINSGSWTSSDGTVNSGDTVTTRLTSSSSYSTTTNATLTIGGVIDTFSVTTLAADGTPDTFTFTDQTGTSISSVVTSNAITIPGINVSTSISISGGEYSVNGGNYTASAGTVNNGDTVTVRQTSSSSYSTTTDAVLTIGGISDTFSVTTTSPGGIDSSGPSANRVDGYDLIKLSLAFGSSPGDAAWNQACNLDNTGTSYDTIDGSDLIILGAHFGEVE